MTEDQLVEWVFSVEGDEYGDQRTRVPIDQPTGRGGITLGALAAFFHARGSAFAFPITAETLRKLSHEQAAEVVRWTLDQLATETKIDQIEFEQLRLQMLDWSYNSGPATAIKWLQSVLRVPIDGTIGPVTLRALYDQDEWLVNQALVAARLQFIDRWTDRKAQRKAWEEGLESRGLLFSLLEIPRGY